MDKEIEGIIPDDNFFVSPDFNFGEFVENPDPDPDFLIDEEEYHHDDSFHNTFYPKDKKQHYKYTYFKEVFDFFLAGITDDMFMELTKEDTEEILQEIMLAALPYFEFARHDLFDMDLLKERFNFKLTVEEMMIIRQYMIAQWIGYQLATIDLIKQKYSGSDFKFTSQASHIKQLQAMKVDYERQGFHLQRLYKRRERKSDGRVGSTMAMIMEKPKS